MTELEIMKRAQMYIDSLARGIDPLTGQPVKADDIVNNIRISKCLYYVSGVLGRVIECGGEIRPAAKAKKYKDKDLFTLTAEQIERLVPSDTPLTASKLTARINSLIDTNTMHKLTATALTSWLVEAGLLEEIVGRSGHKRKVPTEHGNSLGIWEQEFTNNAGVHLYCTYDSNAQQFVFDNIPSIEEASQAELIHKEQLRRIQQENKNKPWTDDETERLRVMYECGMSLKDIAEELKRTKTGIKAKLISMELREP
ncbi:MAG: hypothetical protein IJ740_17340 [Ruminococcus sp.]|nr:hypothetical protein [Ruminococcus sp.]